MKHRRLHYWKIVVTLALAGCGSASPFDKVQVSGRVTYEDGSAIPGDRVEVEFRSLTPAIDKKTHPRPGVAIAQPDGSFDVVTSHKYGDGLIVGRHKVLIRSLNTDGRPTGAVPAEYDRSDTTPLEVDTADSPFDLKVRNSRS